MSKKGSSGKGDPAKARSGGRQADITSFFGGKPASAAKRTQTSIASFFGGAAERAPKPPETVAPPQKAQDSASDVADTLGVKRDGNKQLDNEAAEDKPRRRSPFEGRGLDPVPAAKEVLSGGPEDGVVNGGARERGHAKRGRKRRVVVEDDEEDGEDASSARSPDAFSKSSGEGANAAQMNIPDKPKQSAKDQHGVAVRPVPGSGDKQAAGSVSKEASDTADRVDLPDHTKAEDPRSMSIDASKAQDSKPSVAENADVEDVQIVSDPKPLRKKSRKTPTHGDGVEKVASKGPPVESSVKGNTAAFSQHDNEDPKDNEGPQRDRHHEPNDADKSSEDDDSVSDGCNGDGEDDAEDNTRDRGHAKTNSLPGKALAVSLDFSEKPTWAKGKPVPYRFLADAFAKVEAIQGRLEIQAILTDVFRKVIDTTPEDLVSVIYLCVNKLAPAHEGLEIGVGESILLKALAQTTGTTLSVLRARYKEVGDLGDIASGARATQKTMFPPPPLKVRGVFSELRAIAKASGKAATEAKKSKILKLLVAASSKNEARFIARSLQGKLRIHLADKTVITSLANAVTLAKLKQNTGVLLSGDGKKKAKLTEKEERIEEDLKEASSQLSAIYNQLPVWEKIVPPLLREQSVNEALAEACKFSPGIPVSPMLAKPTKEIAEVLTRFAESKFTCEFKYDGERAQIHRCTDGSVHIYSRNAENLTPKYPDLVSSLPKALKDEFMKASFVLDAEAVAYDVEKKKILPFQELQGRKRKDVDEATVKVKVCVFAFDLLYFNGNSMLLEPLEKRRQVLTSSFNEVESIFMFAKGHDSRDPDEIMELLNESIKAGCEGLMVKALDGPNGTYEPANRSQNWLKVKKDYLEGMGDTLDLVPIGGYLGRGKRTGTYGGFLLACYDPDNEEYQSICKIGTGFSEKDLEMLSAFYNDAEAERKLGAPKSYYRLSGNKNLEPDVWFEPCQVWEVKCADLSISPAHTAAIGHVDSEKGIALRFPRFLRLREDKGPEDATNAEQVAEMYRAQSSVANKT